MNDLEQVAWQQAHPSPSILRYLGRFISIAKHYSWQQLAKRAYSTLQRKLYGSRPIGSIPTEDFQINSDAFNAYEKIAQLALKHQRQHLSHSQSRLNDGEVVLLNERRFMGNPWDWSLNSQPTRPTHLWSFQLHYHEFLQSAWSDKQDGSSEQAEIERIILRLLEGWLSQFSPEMTSRSHDAWHPYCISRRIISWLNLHVAFVSNTALRKTLEHSLAMQASHLFRSLETDLGGNHLTENLTALVTYDLIYDSPASERRLPQTTATLMSEIRKQVLPHGEHFERSPVYHLHVLASLLRVLQLADVRKLDIRDELRTYCHRMFSFSESLLHPDLEVPLFGDSVHYESPSVAHVRELAMLCGVRAEESTDGYSGTPYHVVKFGNEKELLTLIADMGELATTGLPAHGHCDLMNFELSVGPERWIVDSGNFDYEDSLIRSYCRSSVAHNVATISMLNHADVWSKFRMGDRGRVKSVTRSESEDFACRIGKHDSYQQIGFGDLCRGFFWDKRGTLIVLDWCMSPIPSGHSLDGFLHFAPGIQAHPTDDGFLLESASTGVKRNLRFTSNCRYELCESWYCPAFGFREKRLAMHYSRQLVDSTFIGWYLTGVDVELELNLNTDAVCVEYDGIKGAGWTWLASASC
ncbi:heparinase II/III domain-containing protein [Pirellulaceae bacterium SH449]